MMQLKVTHSMNVFDFVSKSYDHLPWLWEKWKCQYVFLTTFRTTIEQFPFFILVGSKQRCHRLRFGRQIHQSNGRIPPLRLGQAGLCYDQGMLRWTQEACSHFEKGNGEMHANLSEFSVNFLIAESSFETFLKTVRKVFCHKLRKMFTFTLLRR